MNWGVIAASCSGDSLEGLLLPSPPASKFNFADSSKQSSGMAGTERVRDSIG